MSFYGWKPYVPVAKRREKAAKAVAKAQKAGNALTPVVAFRGAPAKTFWGKAWCNNLECYSDYANRLPRGRTYVRNGSVIDLRLDGCTVSAQVMGSSLYRVEVKIKAVSAARWRTITADCSGAIDTLVELLQGKLSKAVMERISKPGDGLFPAPREIDFQCSCPDWASMCKHVAAVLYGIGNRLDTRPELLFALRGVDAADLIADAVGANLSAPAVAADKTLDDDMLADVFGIELAAPAAVATQKAANKKVARAAKAAPGGKPGAVTGKEPKTPATGKVKPSLRKPAIKAKAEPLARPPTKAPTKKTSPKVTAKPVPPTRKASQT